jgi:two-component system sensor histidine kinase RpfC
MSRQPMNALRFLKTRLRARADSEHEQALVRLSFVGLVLACVALIGGRVDVELILAGYFAVAIGIFAAICVWPAANASRRVLGMVADAGAITFGLFLAGNAGITLFGAYLFIILGNGFRYGPAHLYLCQSLCVAGFVPVVLMAPWWRNDPAIGSGLMTMLIVIPIYVATLLHRVQQARTQAEQALKDCIERQARLLPSSH